MTNLAHDKDPETAKGFPTWMDADEARIANKLISAILRKGYRVRVHDGEEFATHVTSKRALIKQHTAATDITIYQLYRDIDAPASMRFGSITLIHGNGPDLISDWGADNATDLDLIEANCDEVEA